jgi:hypothetical protein
LTWLALGEKTSQNQVAVFRRCEFDVDEDKKRKRKQNSLGENEILYSVGDRVSWGKVNRPGAQTIILRLKHSPVGFVIQL